MFQIGQSVWTAAFTPEGTPILVTRLWTDADGSDKGMWSARPAEAWDRAITWRTLQLSDLNAQRASLIRDIERAREAQQGGCEIREIGKVRG